MSRQIILPTTLVAEVTVDLSLSPGPVTFRADGFLGAGEEITINTVNSDDSELPVVESTIQKVITLDNTTVTTFSPAKFRFIKTATALPVGLIMDRFGL